MSIAATKALLSKFEHSLGGKLGHPNRAIEVEEIQNIFGNYNLEWFYKLYANNEKYKNELAEFWVYSVEYH